MYFYILSFLLYVSFIQYVKVLCAGTWFQSGVSYSRSRFLRLGE